MKNKDILFLCQFFYPEYISSATLPYDTAIALSKAGYSVNVLCGFPKEYNGSKENVKKKEIHEGINIKRARYWQLKRSNFFGRILNFFSFTFSIFLRIFSFRKYKVIIVYSNPPVLPIISFISRKLFHTKIIFVSYDIYPEIAERTGSISESSFIFKIMQLVNKLVYKNLFRVIALSNEMKNFILENRNMKPEAKVEIIPNWYEDVVINDNEIENSKNNPLFKDICSNKKLIVSYFGNMGVCQDMDTLIETTKYYKDNKEVVFLIAGHGIKKESIEHAIKEEQLENIILFDFLHGQDFQDALNISDCFIVSLEKGLSGLAVPSKTYSYMMAAKPIIAIMDKKTDIVSDLLDNNAGFHAEVGDVKAVVESIDRLLDNPNGIQKMGRHCRKVFLDKYEKKICTNQYVKMIHDVMGEE